MYQKKTKLSSLLKKQFLAFLVFILISSVTFSQFLETTNEGFPLTPNPLISAFDYPENLAKATFIHPTPLNVFNTSKLAEAGATAFGTTSNSQQNKVYWEARTGWSSYYSGSIVISSDFVDYVDIAFTNDANDIGTMYILSSEYISSVQYKYIQSYRWDGTDFIFQNKEEVSPPVNAGAGLFTIDCNYSGNFAITWESNIGTPTNPVWGIYGKFGKVSNSFPYYTLSTITNISQASGLPAPTEASSHIYPDVSINNNDKVSFIFAVYPNQVKTVVVEGSVNFTTLQYSYAATRQIGSYSNLVLLYKPKISYWKNCPTYHPNSIQYFNDDYGIVYSVHQQGAPSTYDLISLTSYNGILSAPRILNSLNNLNTIQSNIMEHNIIPFEGQAITRPRFEISTEFDDRFSLIYGTSTSKLLSRTIHLDNSQPIDEHNNNNNGNPPTYFVISHQNVSGTDVAKSVMEGSNVSPFSAEVSFIKASNFIDPPEIINTWLYMCGNECRPTQLINAGSILSDDQLQNKRVENLQTIPANKEVVISPNPSNGIVKIQFSSEENKKINGSYQIDVLNNSGVKILSLTNKIPDYTLNLSNLNNGVYFLRIYSGNFSTTKKISIIK